MGKVKGKVSLITGAARGIGLAAAKRFVAEGSKVLLVDVDESPLREAAEAIGSEHVTTIVADASRAHEVEAFVRAAVERFGGIDVFVANAGVEGDVRPIVEYPTDTFDRVIAVNVRGVWLGLKSAIPEIAKRAGDSIIIPWSIAF